MAQYTRLQRAFFAIPVIGWIARDLMEGDSDNVWYLLVAVASLAIIAAMTWGLPALTIGALIATPLVFFTIVLMTTG